MKVIKLGGSLISDVDSLKCCLKTIEQQDSDKIIIVPGGGVFADQVRNTQQLYGFDDEIAHQMAILAMQQTALLLKSIMPDAKLADNIQTIQKLLIVNSLIIWSPIIQELNAYAIKASWDISSDSLAAWLAGQLNANELILVKSAEIPLESNIQKMQKQGLLDLAFDQFITSASFKITLINKHRFNEYPSL